MEGCWHNNLSTYLGRQALLRTAVTGSHGWTQPANHLAAGQLTTAGLTCRLLESSDRVGGRVATDEIDGFLLDRGFQVFLLAYPEAQAALDYQQLELRRFEPGALVRFQGKFHRLSDPWRRPRHLLATALSPVATLGDKLRIASFRRHATQGSLEELYARPEQRTIDLLREHGFSGVIIERFFRPFLGGVFLDRELATSSRLCDFVFRMFSLGDAAIPAAGMQQIPRQLAQRLPPGTVELNCPVEAIDDRALVLADGQRLSARAIVMAVEAPAAQVLLGDAVTNTACRSVCCHYFAADRAPLAEPILVLNGDGTGPINNLCVPSQVAPGYAPEERSLVSVTTLDDRLAGDELLLQVRQQLSSWFGSVVDSWQHLMTYDISYALPMQEPPALDPVAKPVMVRDGVFVCGDYLDTASINGAMAAGRRAAQAVLDDWQNKSVG